MADETKKPGNEAKKGKTSDCAACGKHLRGKSWYYRNEKYYCSKRCFKAEKKKQEKK